MALADDARRFSPRTRAAWPPADSDQAERSAAPGVVYVVNHTSYLDHLALAAVLPGDLAFAAYKELAEAPIQGPFVRRLGAFFVERFEPVGAAAEVSRALDILRFGRPLVIYPEATIMRMPVSWTS